MAMEFASHGHAEIAASSYASAYMPIYAVERSRHLLNDLRPAFAPPFLPFSHFLRFCSLARYCFAASSTCSIYYSGLCVKRVVLPASNRCAFYSATKCWRRRRRGQHFTGFLRLKAFFFFRHDFAILLICESSHRRRREFGLLRIYAADFDAAPAQCAFFRLPRRHYGRYLFSLILPNGI